uniref:THAP-type domain-containing protein n=1 Tax=Rhipicephalus zambeziensis TaxID=60191 RepID=A0A224Z2A3_9ACAR
MFNCAVFKCSNRTKWKGDASENAKQVKFYSLPNVIRGGQCSRALEVSAKRRDEWFSRLRRADFRRLCGERLRVVHLSAHNDAVVVTSQHGFLDK